MKAILVMACLLAASGLEITPTIRIDVDRTTKTADVRATGAALVDLTNAARLRAGTAVSGTIPDRTVTMSLRRVPLDDLVEVILSEAGLSVKREHGALHVRSVEERTASLDLVDADLEPTIRSLAEQCGIPNVMIDPNLKRSGATFRFREVPCSSAFDVVFSTMRVNGRVGGSIVVVRGH